MKTLFEQSCPGRVGVIPRKPGKRASDMLSASLLRRETPRLPELSELDVVRHFTGLSLTDCP